MTKEEFLNSLIEIGKSDLDASKLLYDNGYYLQSTFYLQQGIEKANKAFGLFGEYLEAKDMRKLGHDHVEIHKKIINHQLNQAKVFEDKNLQVQKVLQTISKQTKFDYTNYKYTLESSRYIKEEMKSFNIIHLSEDELTELISEIGNVDSEMDFEINITEPTIHQLKLKFRNWIYSLFKNLKKIDPTIDMEEVKTLFNKTETLNEIVNATIMVIEYQKRLKSSFVKLYILGFITSSLASVRYPDINSGFNPITTFTKNHPLISKQPKFHHLAATSLDNLAQLISENIA